MKPAVISAFAYMQSAKVTGQRTMQLRPWQHMGHEGRYPLQPVRAAAAAANAADARAWIDAWKEKNSGERVTAQSGTALKIEAGQADLKKAAELRAKAPLKDLNNFPVKALRSITALGASVKEGTLGSFSNGLITWDDGSYSQDRASPVLKKVGGAFRTRQQIAEDCISRGVDWDIVKNTPYVPRDMDAKIGLEVSKEDLEKAFTDLAGMDVGDLVAVQRSDGKWTYAEVLRPSGSTRRDFKGLALNFRVGVGPFGLAGGATKKFMSTDWDKVKQLKAPEPYKGGVMPLLYSKLGGDVSEEDLQNASGDLFGISKGDLVAVLRSSGKWTYARVKEVAGKSRLREGEEFSALAPGMSLILKVGDDDEKKVPSAEIESTVKAFRT